MLNDPAPTFVIRLNDVALDREALQSRLGVELDRYEPLPHGPLFYAQIVMQDGGRDWYSVAWFLKQVGPKLSALIDDLAVGSATIDFAAFMADNHVSKSLLVPARIATLAGENQIDIEASVYLTLSES